MSLSYYQAPPDLMEEPEALLSWATGAFEAARRAAAAKRPSKKTRR
jgi:TfoX/Sxy family transcriptional regulator of competence genes